MGDDIFRQRLLAKETSLRALSKKYLTFVNSLDASSEEEVAEGKRKAETKRREAAKAAEEEERRRKRMEFRETRPKTRSTVPSSR